MSIREIEPVLKVGYTRGMQPDISELMDLINSPGYSLLVLTKEEIDEIYATLILPGTSLDTFTKGNLQKTYNRLMSGNYKPDAWNLFRMTVVMVAAGTINSKGQFRCANPLNTFSKIYNSYNDEQIGVFYFSVKFDESK